MLGVALRAVTAVLVFLVGVGQFMLGQNMYGAGCTLIGLFFGFLAYRAWVVMRETHRHDSHSHLES